MGGKRGWDAGYGKNKTATSVRDWKKKMIVKGKEHMLSPNGKKKCDKD